MTLVSGTTQGLGFAQPIPASIIVKEGDPVAGSSVATIGAPYINSHGQVGCIFTLSDGRHGIWFENQVRFISTEASEGMLSISGYQMGISDNGAFAYRPLLNGFDAIWTDHGVTIQEGDPAPGFPDGIQTLLHAQPQMLPDGTAYWIAETTQFGCLADEVWTIYELLPSGTISPTLQVDGCDKNVRIDLFHVSDNRLHRIDLRFSVGGGSCTSGRLFVDDTQIRFSDCDSFTTLRINNLGHYAFKTESAGDLYFDNEFLLRDGDTIPESGHPLFGNLGDFALNNSNQAAFIWAVEIEGSNIDTLFVSPNASLLPGGTYPLLTRGDLIDINGDGEADWRIINLRPISNLPQHIDLADSGDIAARVELISLDGALRRDAIIRIRAPRCNEADLAPPDHQLDFSDVIQFLSSFVAMNPLADFAEPFGVFSFDDVVAFLSAFSAGCP
ncbi:MAG: GC-type dockerin domain-anchored protein [Phycisphaerales bacterium]